MQNLHAHSVFCDGKNMPEEMIRACLAAGMDSAGISIHSPLPFANGWAAKAENVAPFLAEMQRLKAAYAGRIAVYAGVEWDVLSDAEWLEPFDYAIGSAHFLPVGGDPAAYPTVDGRCGGTPLAESTHLYSVMEKSEKKDAAWLFLREAVDGQSGENGNMPVYRSDFRTLVDAHGDTMLTAYYSGGGNGMYYSQRFVDNWDETRGTIIMETDVDWDEIEAWIDSIGLPITEYANDDEMWNILYEETETYLSGSRDAALTADFIESRVTIYLEETKKGKK